MKKYILILWIVMGGFGMEGFGQVTQVLEWKWQNPLPTGSNLNDISILDSLNAIAIGDFGTIIKTSDGGVSWQNQDSGTLDWLYSIHFVDFQIGWAVGSNGAILKTTNGGSDWIKQNSQITFSLNSVYFTDALNGWAVGPLSNLILKTTNGGISWQNESNGNNNNLCSIFFIDSQIGWTVGANGTILKTSNGGSSWQNQISGTTNFLRSVHFFNSQIGLAVGLDGTIVKTTNGGALWEIKNSGTLIYLQAAQFADSLNGWAVGSQLFTGENVIIKTINGGNNWFADTIAPKIPFASVSFLNALRGWAVGDNGTIIKTSDGGNSWNGSNRIFNLPFHSVNFINNQTGWVVGVQGKILKTTNSGFSWIDQNSGTANPLYSVSFTDHQTGIVVGDNGIILKTTNGGTSWQNQNSGVNADLKSVCLVNAQKGFAVGIGGTLIRTNNGGISWIPGSGGVTTNLNSVFFINSQIGWAVGEGGPILKTTNGGMNWVIQISGSPNSLFSVFFINSQIGWAVGSQGLILKTTNGGTNWVPMTSGMTSTLKSVFFIDPLNGWAVGLNGKMIKTINGGVSWQMAVSGTSSSLHSIFCTDGTHGWAVGDNENILCTITNNPISPETPNTLIAGTLFEKTTTNCNPSPIPIANQLVKALPGPYYGISDNQGKYNLRLPLADTATPFTIQALEYQNSALGTYVVCPANNQYNVLLDTIPDTLIGKDFGFEITPCHHLDVQIASNRRRRCFINTTAISYNNDGSLAAPDAFVLVEYPHWVRPVRASRPFIALNDSVWKFQLGTVLAGNGGSFTIADSVLCGNLNILGLTQCTKATIFPAPDCPASPNYSGAEVSVSGKCNNGTVNLGIYNKTAVAMPDSVDYWVYLDSILVRQAKVKLAAGDSLKMNVLALGLGVHLTVNQVQNHPTDLFLSTNVEACSDTVIFYPRAAVNKFPVAQRPNSKTHCLEIRGSYDPNDKQAFPTGFTANRIVKPGTEMEYLIRFQNSGNDTAFTVYVIDSLDKNLDVESFQMGAASHNYELSLQTVKSGKTFLKWQFNNILLPDSTTNEPKSNGFIQFRISPKSGLALGSQVRNYADIYFDFNPPIVTNQTLTTFNNIVFTNPALNNNVQIINHIGPKTASQIGVKLYPNPVTQNQLTVDFSNKGNLILFNAKGQIVYQAENLEGVQVLPIRLKTGLYFARMQTGKGSTMEKVVVME